MFCLFVFTTESLKLVTFDHQSNTAIRKYFNIISIISDFPAKFNNSCLRELNWIENGELHHRSSQYNVSNLNRNSTFGFKNCIITSSSLNYISRQNYTNASLYPTLCPTLCSTLCYVQVPLLCYVLALLLDKSYTSFPSKPEQYIINHLFKYNIYQIYNT